MFFDTEEFRIDSFPGPHVAARDLKMFR
jgi:hypothetical protein